MVTYNAHGRENTLVASICLPIAVLTVVLRFVARARINQKVTMEDLCAVMSLVFFAGFCGALIWGMYTAPRMSYLG